MTLLQLFLRVLGVVLSVVCAFSGVVTALDALLNRDKTYRAWRCLAGILMLSVGLTGVFYIMLLSIRGS